jgi:hypothetical protein
LVDNPTTGLDNKQQWSSFPDVSLPYYGSQQLKDLGLGKGGEGNQHFEDKIARFTPSQIQEPFIMGEKIVMGVHHG